MQAVWMKNRSRLRSVSRPGGHFPAEFPTLTATRKEFFYGLLTSFRSSADAGSRSRRPSWPDGGMGQSPVPRFPRHPSGRHLGGENGIRQAISRNPQFAAQKPLVSARLGGISLGAASRFYLTAKVNVPPRWAEGSCICPAIFGCWVGLQMRGRNPIFVKTG